MSGKGAEVAGGLGAEGRGGGGSAGSAEGEGVGRCGAREARRPRGDRVLVELALGVSVAQAAGARKLASSWVLEALRGRGEVGWRPNVAQ